MSKWKTIENSVDNLVSNFMYAWISLTWLIVICLYPPDTFIFFLPGWLNFILWPLFVIDNFYHVYKKDTRWKNK